MDIKNFNFAGTRWPKAKFENGLLIANGQGRARLGYGPTASWRILGDIDIGDDADLQEPEAAGQALAYIQNIGLPGGYDLDRGPVAFALDGSSPASDLFIRLIMAFSFMASEFWQPIDKKGISKFRPIAHQVDKPRNEGVQSNHPATTVGRIVFGPHGLFGDWGLYIACDTLDDYLWASAAIHVDARQTFARCRQCNAWFTPMRPSRALYCSPTCRAAANKPPYATLKPKVA